MHSRILVCWAVACALASQAHEMFCAGGFRTGAPIDSPEFRKYAPERLADILHLSLDVTPDFRERSVTGTATIRFRPLQEGLSEFHLNAVDLRVDEVTAETGLRAYQNTGHELIVTFSAPLPKDAEQTLVVRYKAYPRKGLYFRTAEMGYKPEDEHLFSQGEDIEARHWFPCFDAPNEKFTSEITCRVPESMTVLSNGRLVEEKPLPGGLKAVRWAQEKPHVSYLISLVAGRLKKIEDQYKNIHLAFYTPSSQIDLARNSFAETKEMMAFFEEEIGVPYPWHKYYQVCVQDFMWGGMENTSVTTLTDRTLFPAETENIRSSQGLVAHELAHQWFGDLVTCKDWSQIWLNEGFATYYAHLYNLHQDGQEDFLYGLYNSARGFINRSVAEDSRPVVFRRYDAPKELFGYLVYPKGGWVLHMLRNELGPDLYRDCIRAYLQKHQFGTVATHDLMAVIEEKSGRSFDRFFDQWIFHPHHPELQAKYAWDEKEKLARISIAQVQQLTNGVALFQFPLKVRFKGPFGTVDRLLQITEKQTDFFTPLPSAPTSARLDPDYTLLAKIDFDLPRPLWVAQLKDESDLIGRMIALGALSRSKDLETVQLIAERLRNDPFYGVRIEAAEALRKIHTPEALQALIQSAEQKDARVRQKIVMETGAFFDERAAEFARTILAKEKNPDIRHYAARALGAYPGAENRDALLAALRSDSYRDFAAQGAIAGLRARGEPALIESLITELADSRNDFIAAGFSAGLEAIAALGSELDNKDAAYNFLLAHASSPRQDIKLAALRALGRLGDQRAVPVLAAFESGAKDAPETATAASALEALRASRRRGNELQSLRGEVLELQQQNRELKKSFEELKKLLQAREAVPPSEPKPATARRKRG